MIEDLKWYLKNEIKFLVTAQETNPEADLSLTISELEDILRWVEGGEIPKLRTIYFPREETP